MINATVTGILTLLVMAGSLCISLLSSSCRNEAFFLTVCTILLAELLVGITIVCQIFKRKRDNVIFVFGSVTIACICYLLFTLLGSVLFAAGVSLVSLSIFHIAGAVIFIVIAGAFLMLAAGFEKNSAEITSALANKKMFKMEIARFKLEHAELISSSPDLEKIVDDVEDALRYASDSVDGADFADEKLSNAIDALFKSASEGNSAACVEAAANILKTNIWRQIVIKEKR